MITGLNHVTFAVSDLDRSFDFYGSVLGFRPEARWDAGAYLSAGKLWLCLSVGEVVLGTDYTHVAFSVSPGRFADAVARLSASGAPRWQRNGSEGDSHYFLDPDGHRLELHDGDLDSRLAAVSLAPYAGWRRLGAAGAPAGTVRIRLARPADVAALQRCTRAAYARYVPRIGREPAPMSADVARAVDQERVRLIERDGQLAGHVVIERREQALLLESVAVFPAHAGTGLGRRLIETVEQEARWLGLDRVALYTHALMQENIALYRYLGYTETGRRSEQGFERVFFEKCVSDEVAGTVTG